METNRKGNKNMTKIQDDINLNKLESEYSAYDSYIISLIQLSLG